MAIIVSTNAQILVNGTDFSDHCLEVRVNDGQETREVTAMGDTTKRFRAGVGTASIEATFWGDVASTSGLSQTMASLVSVSSTGFPVVVRKVAAARSTSNPEFSMAAAVLDGEVNVVDSKHGDVDQLKVRFVPYSTFTIVTSGS